MPFMRKAVVIMCTISLTLGISTAIVGAWAFYIKFQNLENLYPNADKELESGDHYKSRKMWDQMKSDWKNVQSRDLATIGVAIASGLVQFVIAIILMYSKAQASSKTIAVRYILSNIVVMFVLLLCNLTTVSTHNMHVQLLPLDLKISLGLVQTPLIMEVLAYGINAFNIFMGIDDLYLFFSIVTLSWFIRNLKSDEIIVTSGI